MLQVAKRGGVLPHVSGSSRGEALSSPSASTTTAAAPLVLLHPLGSTGTMSWTALAKPLRAAGHRISAPDLPGHGDARTIPFSWENAAAVVGACAEEFGEDKPVLVGLSLGAATALYAAQRDPARFAGVILTGAGTCWNDRKLRLGLSVAAAVGALSAAVGRRELLTHAAGVRGAEIVSAARNAHVAPAQLWRAARQLMRFDVRGTPVPPLPCVVVVLTHDRRMPPGLQRALARTPRLSARRRRR